MWPIIVAVLLNVAGLVLLLRPIADTTADRASRQGRAAHRLALLAGCLLLIAGQYQAMTLLLRQGVFDEVELLTKAAAAGALVLLLVSSLFVRSAAAAARRGGVAPYAAPVPATGSRAIVRVLLVVALLLAALNAYQYVANVRMERLLGIRAASPAPLTPSAARAAATTPSTQVADIVRPFARLFHDNVYGIEANRTKWMGFETLQNPNDAWIHQELITELKPDYIIETGTWHGGSALMWAMILREVNPAGRVITVDIADMCARARTSHAWKERIEFFHGSSTDPQIVSAINRRVQGSRVLVILDSHHGADHVFQELKMYSPMVSEGSYIVAQDTFFDYPPAFHPQEGPGPWTAVQRFLAQTDAFEIDASRERLLFTLNPGAHLKRVKRG